MSMSVSEGLRDQTKKARRLKFSTLTRLKNNDLKSELMRNI